MRPNRHAVTVVAALMAIAGVTVASVPRTPAAARLDAAERRGLLLSPDHRGDPHNAVIAVRTSRRSIALTFDDGPDPRFTPQILRLLAANHAHATFFAIGRRVAAHPALARATVAAGNEVGNHTLDHVLLPPLHAAGIRHQIDAGQLAFRRAGLPEPRTFRPPHGFFDARVSAAAAARGLPTIGWNAVVERALHGRTTAQATAELLASLRPGAIVLAHDGRRDRSRTVAVIARLLPALRARGISVVTVSRLLAGRRSAHHRPAHLIASSSPLSLPTTSVPSAASAG